MPSAFARASPLRRPLQLIGCSTPQFVRHSLFLLPIVSKPGFSRRSSLKRSLRDCLAATSSLSISHVHGPFAVNAGPHQIDGRSCSSSPILGARSLGSRPVFQWVELQSTPRALNVVHSVCEASSGNLVPLSVRNAPPSLIFNQW